MTWFELVFVPAMLLMPLGFFLRMRAFAKGRLRERPGSEGLLPTLLCAGTAVSLGLFFILQEAAPHVASKLWLLFFPLWFGVVMPMLVRRYPALNSPHPEGSTVRSASLRPRERENPIPSWVWWPLGAFWVTGVAAIAVAFDDTAEPAARLRCWVAILCQLVCGAVILAVGPWSLRLLTSEPEPLDESGSPELIEGYRSLRRFRAWGLFGLCVTLMLMNTTFLVILAHGVGGQELGLIGGALGTAVGLAGAAFGTIAGIRRARLTQRLNELTHSSPND